MTEESDASVTDESQRDSEEEEEVNVSNSERSAEGKINRKRFLFILLKVNVHLCREYWDRKMATYISRKYLLRCLFSSLLGSIFPGGRAYDMEKERKIV